MHIVLEFTHCGDTVAHSSTIHTLDDVIIVTWLRLRCHADLNELLLVHGIGSYIGPTVTSK